MRPSAEFSGKMHKHSKSPAHFLLALAFMYCHCHFDSYVTCLTLSFNSVCILTFTSVFFVFNFFLIKYAIFTDNTAAVTPVLWFPRTSLEWLWICQPTNYSVSPLRHLPIICNCIGHIFSSEASKKWWRLVSTIFPAMWGLIHLEVFRSSTLFNFCSHLSQSFLSFRPAASHCIFWLHKVRSNFLPSNLNGLANPNGS